MKTIKQILSSNSLNFKSFKTNRRIIVFESDDWGSIRMPNKEVYEELCKNKIPVNKSAYCKFDTLESNSDLENLFEVLLNFRDSRGNHPVITANTVVANPNFDKICESNFQEYINEPFNETLLRYENRDKVFNYYKYGIDKNIFFPQFHGREHVNVEFWFELLRVMDEFKIAFNLNTFGLSNDVFPLLPKSVQATHDSLNLDFLKRSIQTGLNIFEDLFCYKSKSFIANNFIWSPDLNKTLNDCGVEFLQGMKYQISPIDNKGKRAYIRHFCGERNSLGQYYLVRNASFEPSVDNESIDKTIWQISNAFFWNTPAIISTHRINFMGELEINNRINNLKSFESLLKYVTKKWPNVEFLSSSELGNIIKRECAE